MLGNDTEANDSGVGELVYKENLLEKYKNNIYDNLTKITKRFSKSVNQTNEYTTVVVQNNVTIDDNNQGQDSSNSVEAKQFNTTDDEQQKIVYAVNIRTPNNLNQKVVLSGENDVIFNENKTLATNVSSDNSKNTSSIFIETMSPQISQVCKTGYNTENVTVILNLNDAYDCLNKNLALQKEFSSYQLLDVKPSSGILSKVSQVCESGYNIKQEQAPSKAFIPLTLSGGFFAALIKALHSRSKNKEFIEE